MSEYMEEDITIPFLGDRDITNTTEPSQLGSWVSSETINIGK